MWLLFLASSLLVIIYYLVVAWDLPTMWWGTAGDELFISSFLMNVVAGQGWHDFYHAWLPNFYPPLYFWLTGLIAMPWVQNGIAAAKVGVIGSFLLWFTVPYFFYRKYKTWLAWLLPLLVLLTLDFHSIVLKPYEAITAIFCTLWLMALQDYLRRPKWNYKNFLFFGISGGLLFLTYYFWWFIVVPAGIGLALLSESKKKSIARLSLVGAIILLTSSIYTAPLLHTYISGGLENWQGHFLVMSDLNPWLNWPHRWWIALGIVGLFWYRKKPFVKSALLIFIFCWIYFILNLLSFYFWHSTWQPSKPFWFLGTSAALVGLSYLVMDLPHKITRRLQRQSLWTKAIIAGFLLLIFISSLPWDRPIDNPALSYAPVLAQDIKSYVPDYQERTWLSSGLPQLNAYIPLSYYIGYNAHFSHPAILFSQRLDLIKKANIDGVDALLLYDSGEDTYDLHFWVDNWPNGGKSEIIKLPKYIVTEKYWIKVYEKNNWLIFIKNN